MLFLSLTYAAPTYLFFVFFFINLCNNQIRFCISLLPYDIPCAVLLLHYKFLASNAFYIILFFSVCFLKCGLAMHSRTAANRVLVFGVFWGFLGKRVRSSDNHSSNHIFSLISFIMVYFTMMTAGHESRPCNM